MKLKHLPETAVFVAEPKPRSSKHFTFDEYLAWYDNNGAPCTEEDTITIFLSLCGENAKQARVDAWFKVLSWRAEVQKDDPVYQKAQAVLRAYHDRN